MMERIKRTLPYVGYAFFYGFVFLLGCYLTFPYHKLKDRLIAEFAAQQKGKLTTQKLEIDDLEPYWFTGIRARGVRLSITNAPKITGETDPPTVLEWEELQIHYSLLARFFGKHKVSFLARAFGGQLEGTFWDSSTERHLDFEMSDITVGRVEPLRALLGLPMFGSMQGKVDLTFPDKRASKGEGSIKLTLVDLAVGDGKAKLKDTLALPKIQVGELTLEATVKEGLVVISKLEAQGKDVDLAADGTIRLKDQPTESLTDLYLRFRINDSYRNRNDQTRGLFGAPGSSTPALIELADPKVKNSKRPDGFYGWHAVGLISSLRFEPFPGNPPANRLTPSPAQGAIRGFVR
ncbi:MAG: type II secretion system protein GspN [Myxococcales bacterium]|nr:type II secretion system protein GspN [Polyangiaceae bacterium]MDW8250654.1 type II secretion system protein GspN [Myxococcales bacterium]